MNNKIKHFLGFVEHHEPSFYKHEDDNTSYCFHMNCIGCVYHHRHCEDNVLLTDDDVKTIKENYPEYFL